MVFNRKRHFAYSSRISPTQMSRKQRIPSPYRVALSMVVVAMTLGQAQVASAAITSLTEAAQGSGNQGASWTPIDSLGNPASFIITAQSSVDSTDPFSANAPGNPGTVYIKNSGRGYYGVGVQDSSFGGSSGISGGGGDSDEELIFTYNSPVSLNSIFLELSDIEFVGGRHNSDEKDNPVLFISQAGSSGQFDTVTEADIVSAFTFTDYKKGILDFGALSLGYTEIDAFKIRETNGHIYVSGISEATSVPVPTPSASLLAGLGTVFVSWIHRRRNL